MRQAKKRSVSFFIASVFFITALAFTIISIPPTKILQVGTYPFPALNLFFLLLFFFLFFLISFLLKAKRHGALISLLVIAYLLLRLYHLNNLFFGILLLSLFLVLELLFGRQK